MRHLEGGREGGDPGEGGDRRRGVRGVERNGGREDLHNHISNRFIFFSNLKTFKYSPLHPTAVWVQLSSLSALTEMGPQEKVHASGVALGIESLPLGALDSLCLAGKANCPGSGSGQGPGP